MKNIILINIILLFSNIAFAFNPNNNWDNAIGNQKNKMDFRLMSYSDLGISEDNSLSLRFNPLSVLLSPSIDLKYSISDKELSFYGGINYPSMLLKLLQRKGAGGFLSPELAIPQLISLRFGYEQNLPVNHWLRFYSSIGFEFSPINKLERSMTIDIPAVIPQLAVYTKKFGINASVSMQGNIWSDFDYYLKLSSWIFPLSTEDISADRLKYMNSQEQSAFVEINPMIIWNTSNTFQVAVGAKITNGDYLFGTTWNTIPHIDFNKVIEF